MPRRSAQVVKTKNEPFTLNILCFCWVNVASCNFATEGLLQTRITKHS
jgi:hypothetical protein